MTARVSSDRHADTPVAAEGEFQPLELGPLKVWPPVVLAPMAGVTNLAYRSLCREMGAGLYVSEMITARGFLMGNRLTTLLAEALRSNKPQQTSRPDFDSLTPREKDILRLIAEGLSNKMIGRKLDIGHMIVMSF